MPKSQEPTSRRSFLKAIGSSSIAVTLRGEASLAVVAPAESSASTQSADSARGQKTAARLIDLVNPLQGTDSSDLFSHGNTLPLVAMPFGMAHWTLQTNSSGPWFFRPADQRIEGVRCTHQLSPWLSDYGYATFFPSSAIPRQSHRRERPPIDPRTCTLLSIRSGSVRCAID